MTDNTQPEAGSTHIIRYALEMGLLWIDGDGRDKVREALDALDVLEAQPEAIGAGGVSGPLIGQPQAMPDLSQLTERGAKAWAGVDAQGLRDGGASPSANAGEPWTGGEEWEALAWHLCAEENGEDACGELIWEGGPIPEPWGDRWMKYESDAKRIIELVRKFVAAPPTAQAEGWISVDEQLPGPNVEVLCAGQGWGNAFVTACYYDDERREWHPINTHWTDATGQAQYPTHWMPLPLPPTSAEGVEHG